VLVRRLGVVNITSDPEIFCELVHTLIEIEETDAVWFRKLAKKIFFSVSSATVRLAPQTGTRARSGYRRGIGAGVAITAGLADPARLQQGRQLAVGLPRHHARRARRPGRVGCDSLVARASGSLKRAAEGER